MRRAGGRMRTPSRAHCTLAPYPPPEGGSHLGMNDHVPIWWPSPLPLLLSGWGGGSGPAFWVVWAGCLSGLCAGWGRGFLVGKLRCASPPLLGDGSEMCIWLWLSLGCKVAQCPLCSPVPSGTHRIHPKQPFGAGMGMDGKGQRMRHAGAEMQGMGGLTRGESWLHLI